MESRCLGTRFRRTDDLESGRIADMQLAVSPPAQLENIADAEVPIAEFHDAEKAWLRNQRGIGHISNEGVNHCTGHITASAKGQKQKENI